MWKKIQDRIFPFLIAFSALSVSASAAFYSVSGLSKLFAGASLEVIIMASSLEISKLVIASLLYQYWDKLNKGLRAYLTTATVVLILITSMGIYGFLSAAYQETANKVSVLDKKVATLELKKDRFEENKQSLFLEKSSSNEEITNLTNGLSNNSSQYKDKETGQIITVQSSSQRKSLETQLQEAKTNRKSISIKLEHITDSITKLDLQILDLETGNDLAGELGPLQYLSGLTGIPMDRIINVLLLIIIFVFDPLAIALVITANFAFAQLRPKTKENIYGEKVIIKDDVSYPEPQAKPENSDINHNEKDWEVVDEEKESFDVEERNHRFLGKFVIKHPKPDPPKNDDDLTITY